MRRPLSTLALTLTVAGCATTSAGAQLPSRPPMVLPGTAAARAAAASGTVAGSWIVGARPGRVAATIARAHGARTVSDLGTYLVATRHATAFAAALRRARVLVFAEPDLRVRRAAFEARPDLWSRGAIASPTLLAPPTGAAAAGIIDDLVDVTRPDLRNTTVVKGSVRTVEGSHGTEVASVIGAAADGQGILGTYPGARIDSFGMPPVSGCADSAAGIAALRATKVRAINMSYSHPGVCFAEYRELQYALGRGIVTVAAAGNEYQQGNPVRYPAALPHVLSVGAVGTDLRTSSFSTANAAVDLAAPGEAVPVDVPPAFDDDGTVDGFTLADGTSFAAPAVTGAAAFIAATRPRLAAGQIADILRFSAKDIDAPGYDTDTGYGLLNLDRALAEPTPQGDPLEPNDEIMWVDGTAFSSADAPVYKGFGAGHVSASVDRVEDPLDVYRIRIPAGARVTVRLQPRFGDPDLAVFDAGATSTDSRAHRIATSRRRGTRIDAVTVTNRGATSTIAFVAVSIRSGVRDLSAQYRLSFRRLRARG